MPQLAGLVSLLRGIDMSPLQNARDTSLRRGGLIEQNRAAQAAEALQSRSLDITETGQQASILSDQERLKLGKDELTFRMKEAEEQRTLERELSKMRQEGAVDLQNLVGAQQIANINLRGALDQSLEQDRIAAQETRDRFLTTLSGDALEKELELRAAEEERQYKLNKSRGLDPGADSQLERDIKGIQKARMDKQKQFEDAQINGEMRDMASVQRHQKEMRRLTEVEQLYKLKRMYRELEETDPGNPHLKEMKALEMRMGKAGAEKLEAEAESEKQDVELRGMVIEKEKQAGKDAEDVEAGYLSLKDAKEGKVPRGATKFLTGEESDAYKADQRAAEKEFGGVSDGLSARLEAFKGLEELADASDTDSVAIRKALRRFLAATSSPGAKKVDISFGSVDRQWNFAGKEIPGGPITKAQADEIDAALEELDKYGYTLGENLFG